MGEYTRLLSGVVVSLMVFTFAWSAVPAQAFGLSPGDILLENVLRGASQTSTIRLTRSPEDTGEMHLSVSVSGDYAEYLEFEDQLVIDSGVHSVLFPFTINAQNAATGDYEVLLTFLLQKTVDPNAPPNVGQTVSVLTGGTARIRFTVSGEEVVAYTVMPVKVNETEVSSPIFIDFAFKNEGNVDWRPESARVSFVNVSDQSTSAETTLTEDLFTVAHPGEVSEQKVQVENTLGQGTYTAHVSVVDNGVVVKELDSDPFTVYPPGTLAQSGELISVEAKKTLFKAGEKVLLAATFKNTGEVPLTAVMVTTLYNEDTYVDLVRGENVTVGIGQEVVLNQALEPKDGGDHVAETYIQFGSRQTPTVKTAFVVESSLLSRSFNSIVGMAILAGLIIAVTAFVAHKRKGRLPTAEKAVKSASENLPKPVVKPTPSAPVKSKVKPAPIVPEVSEAPGVDDDATRGW